MSRRAIAAVGCLGLIALCLSLPAAAQIEPRESTADYPHSCQIGDVGFGVEYLARSLPTAHGMQIVPTMLVMELAAFPAAGEPISVQSHELILHWKKRPLGITPMHRSMVLAYLANPDWGYYQKPRAIWTIQDVMIGGPPNQPKFPGDPTVPNHYPWPEEAKPNHPDAPDPEPRHPDDFPEAVVVRDSFPEHEVDRPAAGFLYYDYTGRVKKLKGLTLTIKREEGECSVRLRD